MALHRPAVDTLLPNFHASVLHFANDSTGPLPESPQIMRLDNALADDEIACLLTMAKPLFQRSTIVVDGKLIHSTSRTSQTASITALGQKGLYHAPVERLLKRLQFLANCERHQIESLMVVKYEEGEKYNAHFDFFEPHHTPQLQNGGQRVSTFFFYLNDVDEGGHTHFPRLDLCSEPKKGSGVFWRNCRPSDATAVYRSTEHAGMPVVKGVKYGLNVWIREHGWK